MSPNATDISSLSVLRDEFLNEPQVLSSESILGLSSCRWGGRKDGSLCPAPPRPISCGWRSQEPGEEGTWKEAQDSVLQMTNFSIPNPPGFPFLQGRLQTSFLLMPSFPSKVGTTDLRCCLSQCQGPVQAPSGCLWAPETLQGTGSGPSAFPTAVWGWRQGWSLVTKAISWAMP